MNPEHFIISKQTALKTWVTPATAFPVSNFDGPFTRNADKRRLSGPDRGVYAAWQTGKEVTGSLEMPAFGEGLGMFLAALQMVGTPSQPDDSGNPTVYEHGFLFADSAAAIVANCLSIQVQNSATVGRNILGALVDKLTITCKAGEVVMLTADMIAVDEAKCGDTWDYDGATASPDLVASPTYFSRAILPFIFTGATLTTGGTVSLDGTTKQMSVSGGTAQTVIESMEITIENGGEAVLGTGSPCAQQIVVGDRTITFSFDRSAAVIDTNFYDEARAGTQVALQMAFLGQVISSTYRRAMEITCPLVHFDEANLVAIGGDKKRKTQSVSGEAIIDPTLTYDIGITLRDTQESY